MNKEYYINNNDNINYKYIKETYRELSFLFQCVNDLQQTPNNYTVDDLASYFWTKYPDSDRIVYDAIISSLYDISVTPETVQTILQEVKEKEYALKLSEISYKVAQGISSYQDLATFIAERQVDHNSNATDEDFVSTDLEELIEKNYVEQGYRWRLDCLNKSLGSLRRGDFGFIFARPETGKTTFLASECSEFLKQLQGPIIWFNNEEQGYKVMLRIYQAFFGVTTDQLLSNVKKFKEEFERVTHGMFYLKDSAEITKGLVEKLVDRIKPGLVIYDQITKIRGFKADRNDLMLGDICQWARELAKGNHAAIGVSQADGTAEGVRYLTMEHVANAKTAMQAEADFILGIGKIHNEGQEYVRFLNISKNKLIGDEDSIPDLRHGKFEVLIEPQVARYRDIINFS